MLRVGGWMGEAAQLVMATGVGGGMLCFLAIDGGCHASAGVGLILADLLEC